MYMDKLVQLLEKNARISDQQLAVMTGLSVEEVREKIYQYEKKGILRGYKALIDWEQYDSDYITSMIELKVTPEKDKGFEDVAKQIMEFDEVESVYLMSGTFDLCVTVTGRDFHEVALFVAEQLSPIESVVETSTHFVLRRYKDRGVKFYDSKSDERGKLL